MSLNKKLKDDINRLIPPQTAPSTTTDRPVAARILAQSGTGLPAATNAADASASLYSEVITVWSNIILTENGAFEKPTGWPTSSNINGLAVGDAYYEQKRVHTSYFYTNTGKLVGQNYLISFEPPYENTFANDLSQVPATVKLHVASFNVNGSAGVVAAKLAELGIQ